MPVKLTTREEDKRSVVVEALNPGQEVISTEAKPKVSTTKTEKRDHKARVVSTRNSQMKQHIELKPNSKVFE